MGIFDKIKKLLKKEEEKPLVKKQEKVEGSDIDLSKAEEELEEKPTVEVAETETDGGQEVLPKEIEVEEEIIQEEETEVEESVDVEENEDVTSEVEESIEEEVEIVEETIPDVEETIPEIEEEEVIPEIEEKPVEKASKKTEKAKLDAGLKKTKDNFFGKLARTVAGKSTIDELALDDIEEALITSDIGVETTLKIIERLEERVEKDKYINSSELNGFLKDEISSLMEQSYNEIPEVEGPYVIMVVGVNGVGKTTTIGKLAHQFKQEGKKVVLGAADTFRAAAVDQLVIWADRVGVEIVKQDMGSDPASVAFDTIQSAKASNADVVIIDTAGRLHNNVNLMRELGKIRTVMGKVISEAPHDVMLVLDASTGQNAIEQAKQFTAATDVNSLALTKLDGTAKGGVVIGISDQFNIPVRYIGVGEGMEDLQKFNKEEFVDSLFN